MSKFGDMKRAAKQSLKKSWGNCLLAEVVSSAVEFVAATIPFGGTIVCGAFNVGKTEMYIKGSEHEKPEFKTLLSGFKDNFGENFLLGLLTEVFCVLWGLLFIIPGIVKSYSYAMSTYLITKDKTLSAMEAITKSREMMKGHKFELFLFRLTFIGWDLLAILTLGLALIYITPYKKAACIEFYNRIYGVEEAAAIA